jgi:hypothetical protein
VVFEGLDKGFAVGVEGAGFLGFFCDAWVSEMGLPLLFFGAESAGEVF